MHGKRVAPVDYSAFRPERPNHWYVVRNRSETYGLCYTNDKAPLFTSFPSRGHTQHMRQQWLCGKNEFDRQLGLERHHQTVLQQHRLLEEARQRLLHSEASTAMRRPSKLVKNPELISTIRSALESIYTSNSTTRNTRPSSAPSYVLGGTLDLGAIYMHPRTPETFYSASTRFGEQFDPSLSPQLPKLQVQKACLVVEDPEIALAPPVVLEAVGMRAASECTLPSPPSLPACSARRRSFTCSSRHYDKQLMRFLRASSPT